MNSNSIAQSAQGGNYEQQRREAFAAMIPEMTVSTTGNPRRYVGHPSGWRFVVEGGCFGSVILASPPKHRLDAACFLVDGPAAMRVMELLEVV